MLGVELGAELGEHRQRLPLLTRFVPAALLPLTTSALEKSCVVSQGRITQLQKIFFLSETIISVPGRLTMFKTHSITFCPYLSLAFAQIFRVLL